MRASEGQGHILPHGIPFTYFFALHFSLLIKYDLFLFALLFVFVTLSQLVDTNSLIEVTDYGELPWKGT